MDIFETQIVIANNRELIAQTWEFFVNVHLALIGVMYIASRKIALKGRFMLVPGYLAFLYLNYRAQVDNYGYANVLFDYMRETHNNTAEYSKLNLDVVFQAGWLIDYLPYIFGVAGCFGVGILLLAGAVPKEAKGLEI